MSVYLETTSCILETTSRLTQSDNLCVDVWMVVCIWLLSVCLQWWSNWGSNVNVNNSGAARILLAISLVKQPCEKCKQWIGVLHCTARELLLVVVLHCTVLHYTVLHSALHKVLYWWLMTGDRWCTVPCTVLYCTMLPRSHQVHCTVTHELLLCAVHVWCGTVGTVL